MPRFQRLKDQVCPKKYQLDLDFSQNFDAYIGNAIIILEISDKTDQIWLHASKLDILSVRLERKSEKFEFLESEELLKVFLDQTEELKIGLPY